MKAGYMGSLALALVLVLGGCGDDHSSTNTPTNPFGNAAGGGSDMSSSGVNKGGASTTDNTVGSAAGASASIAGTSAGPEMPGAMNDGGMMEPPMMDGMKPPPPMDGMMPPMMAGMGPGMMPGMMEEMPALVCPATAPMNDTPCTEGRGMCTFGDLKCRCKKEGWSCETAPMMMPSPDGGLPMP